MMRYSLFGESHGSCIGIVLNGLPSGLMLDMEQVMQEMKRRAPGGSLMSTARSESDVPEIVSGLFQGKTTGAPLCALIRNTDARSKSYEDIRWLARPGHADYAG